MNMMEVADTQTRIATEDLVNRHEQPLRHSVQEALQNYFTKLEDALINNLYGMVLAEVEEPLLKAVMSYTHDNQSKAAILLGLSRGTLRKKLRIYGMLG